MFRPSLYSAAEFMSLLESCGFQNVEVFGDLGGAPYDNTAKRLAVMGLKPFAR